MHTHPLFLNFSTVNLEPGTWNLKLKFSFSPALGDAVAVPAQHTNMPVKMRRKSERFSRFMECESIGSGRSGSSTSNHSLTHTTPNETTSMDH